MPDAVIRPLADPPLPGYKSAGYCWCLVESWLSFSAWRCLRQAAAPAATTARWSFQAGWT